MNEPKRKLPEMRTRRERLTVVYARLGLEVGKVKAMAAAYRAARRAA